MQKEKIAGILSNWDAILADARDNIHDNFGESKDIQDILDLIHHLQTLANSDNPLRTLFEEHVADVSNPHEFTIAISDIELFDVLYAEFTSQYGNIMTLAEFITAIIHVKRFADHADVDNQTNLDDAVNLDVLSYAIDSHDTDVDSHGELIRYKFPGEPISIPPSIAIIPNILSDSSIEISRGGIMNVHDTDGRVREVGVDEIAVDYMYGIPTLPIFDFTTNQVPFSKRPNLSLDNVSFSPTSNLSLYTPIDDKDYHLVFEEATDTTHGVSLSSLNVPASEVATFSMYYFPISRRKIRIALLNAADVEVGYGVFDTHDSSASSESNQALNPDDVTSTEIVKLPNNWNRCSLTIQCETEVIVKATIQFMDDSDNLSYMGMGTTVGGLWQFQLVDKPSAAPPIFTDATAVTMPPTKITKLVSRAYNQFSGTVDIKAIVPVSELYAMDYELVTFYNDDTVFISVGNDEMDYSRLKMTTVNADNVTLTEIISEPFEDTDPKLVKQAVLGYTYGHQSYGFTNNKPHVFDYYDNTENGPNVITKTEYDAMAMDYFMNVAGTPPFTRDGAVFLQLQSGDGDPVDTSLPVPVDPNDIISENQLPDTCTSIDLGYNAESNTYLNGYLISFIYYPVFAEPMNIEFLCNEYIPD